MKIYYLFFLLVVYGCQYTKAQQISESEKEEQKFQEILKKSSETAKLSVLSQQKATEKESKIVNNTISKIVDLKEQVKDLKNELKDVKKVLNNINSDTSQKFKLFPISDN
jgi:uncharacterized Zn finger protein (UPF0148 family)